MGCRLTNGRILYGSGVPERTGVEGIPSRKMSDIQLFCTCVEPAWFFVSNLIYSDRRMVAGSSCRTVKGTDNLPVFLGTFINSNLLCIMTDPDQIVRFTAVALAVYKSKLHFLGIILCGINLFISGITDGPDRIGCLL